MLKLKSWMKKKLYTSLNPFGPTNPHLITYRLQSNKLYQETRLLTCPMTDIYFMFLIGYLLFYFINSFQLSTKHSYHVISSLGTIQHFSSTTAQLFLGLFFFLKTKQTLLFENFVKKQNNPFTYKLKLFCWHFTKDFIEI
jgi:hypothetical protein